MKNSYENLNLIDFIFKFFIYGYMDYRYLDAFLSAAKHLNFTIAAKELNITPAAISRQVKLFEQSVDTQLFIRSPQRVVLTLAGKKIYSIAIAFKEKTSEALSLKLKKKIRIGVLAPCLEEWLPNILQKHYQSSEIDFEITSTSPSQITTMLKNGELDIGIYNKNIQTDLLTSRKIYSEQPVLISKERISLSNINKKKWIIVEDKDYLINYAYKKRINKSSTIIKVNSPLAQLKLVEKGLGVSIVSSSLVANNHHIFKKSIAIFSKEFIYLVTPNSELLPEHIQEFNKHLFEA